MTLTDTTLAEIEAAARAATEGPWEPDTIKVDGVIHYVMLPQNGNSRGGDELFDTTNRGYLVSEIHDDRGEGPDGPEGSQWDEPARRDMNFVALACNNAAAMAAEIRALREALKTLTDCQPVPKVYKYTGTAEVDVESMFDVGHRHKSGKQPRDYLMSWLSMFRPFAYATKDDSWGELEKLISIVMNNYVQVLVRAEAARATQKGTSDV